LLVKSFLLILIARRAALGAALPSALMLKQIRCQSEGKRVQAAGQVDSMEAEENAAEVGACVQQGIRDAFLTLREQDTGARSRGDG
jgi:hypothetical protein